MAIFNENREILGHVDYAPYALNEPAEFTMADGTTTVTREFNGKGWRELLVTTPDMRGISKPSLSQTECDALTVDVWGAVSNGWPEGGTDGGHPALAAKLLEVDEYGVLFGDVSSLDGANGNLDGSDGYYLFGAKGYRADPDPDNSPYADVSPALYPRAHAILDYGEIYFNQNVLDYNALINLPDMSSFITSTNIPSEVTVDGASSTVDFSLDASTGILTITTT